MFWRTGRSFREGLGRVKRGAGKRTGRTAGDPPSSPTRLGEGSETGFPTVSTETRQLVVFYFFFFLSDMDSGGIFCIPLEKHLLLLAFGREWRVYFFGVGLYPTSFVLEESYFERHTLFFSYVLGPRLWDCGGVDTRCIDRKMRIFI